MPANLLVSLSAADMPPGTEFQHESNSAQQHWQPQGGEERESHGLDGDNFVLSLV